MDRRFLGYYETELRFLRDLGGEFAAAHPAIAGRLALDPNSCADPYVERLLEGVAFLAARVQLKLDAEFPRFTEHLLDVLFPDFLAPTPSMAIVRLVPDQASGDLAAGYKVAAGTRPDQPARPADADALHLHHGPRRHAVPDRDRRDPLPHRQHAERRGPWTRPRRQGRVHRCASPPSPSGPLRELDLDRLVLHLLAGGRHPWRLYEALVGHGTALMAREPGGSWSTLLDHEPVQRVGFAENEAHAAAVAHRLQRLPPAARVLLLSRAVPVRGAGRAQGRGQGRAGLRAGAGRPLERGRSRPWKKACRARIWPCSPRRRSTCSNARWSPPASSADGATSISWPTGCGRSISRCTRCWPSRAKGLPGPPPSARSTRWRIRTTRRPAAPTTRSSAGSASRPSRSCGARAAPRRQDPRGGLDAVGLWRRRALPGAGRRQRAALARGHRPAPCQGTVHQPRPAAVHADDARARRISTSMAVRRSARSSASASRPGRGRPWPAPTRRDPRSGARPGRRPGGW